MEGNLKCNPLIFKCQLFLFSPLVIQIEKYFFNELHTTKKKSFFHSTFSNGVQTSTEHFLEKEKESFFFCCYVICLFCTLCFLLLPQHVIFLPLPSNAIWWFHSTHVDLKAFTFSFFLLDFLSWQHSSTWPVVFTFWYQMLFESMLLDFWRMPTFFVTFATSPTCISQLVY